MLTLLLLTAGVWIGPTPSAQLWTRLADASKFVASLKQVLLRNRLQ